MLRWKQKPLKSMSLLESLPQTGAWVWHSLHDRPKSLNELCQELVHWPRVEVALGLILLLEFDFVETVTL